jgi:hypothetical protein
MSLNVGDVVGVGINEFVVTRIRDNNRIAVNYRGVPHGEFSASLFTLVTPAGPPPSVLTGMTQFFKDQKDKTNAT